MGTKRAGCEWPPHFKLEDEMIEYAKLHGVEAEVEFESFRDHHLAKGSKFFDWRAAWRTWCRNAEKFKNEKRQIGFTALSRQPEAVMRALKENEEITREVASMTLEQRRAAVAKFQAIISGIKG